MMAFHYYTLQTKLSNFQFQVISKKKVTGVDQPNIKQVLQFINGTSKSQATYAKETKTDENGSAYVYLVRNVLNKYTKSGYYSYTLGKNYNETSFRSLVKENVHANKPIILHAKTRTLVKYNETNLGHYITVGGLSESDYPGMDKTIIYFDTYSHNYGNGNGEQRDLLTNVFNTVNVSGRYIIK